MTTEQQVVVTEGTGASQTIVIEQANPQVMYVPSYEPQVVYGGWPYPSYPPYYWPTPVGYGYPGYAFGSGLAWGAGFAIGAAAWDNAFDWGGHDINVNSNRNNFTNINNNFSGNRANNISNNRSNWQHNTANRRGTNYRDTATRERYGKTNTAAADARRQSRGFDQASVQRQLQQRSNQGQLANRGNQGQFGGQGQLGQQRGNQGQFNQQRGNAGNQFAQNRSNMERRGQTNGFEGAGNGARTRQASARGSSSCQMMAQNASARGGAGVNRGGGGARATGGGGGRGGGGGGRGVVVDAAEPGHVLNNKTHPRHQQNRWNMRHSYGGLRAPIFIGALVFCFVSLVFARGGWAQPSQRTFATPEAGVAALIDAARKNDQAALESILGPGSREVVSSGDPVADAAARDDFLAAYDEKSNLVAVNDNTRALQIGQTDWPLPIPLVREDSMWHFDLAAGRDELINRRIGRNELNAIEAALAFVDAQQDYASADRDGDMILEYAQRFISTPGLKDGLYWPVQAGEEESPLGPEFAEARAEGYQLEGAAPGQPVLRLSLQDTHFARRGGDGRRL